MGKILNPEFSLSATVETAMSCFCIPIMNCDFKHHRTFMKTCLQLSGIIPENTPCGPSFGIIRLGESPQINEKLNDNQFWFSNIFLQTGYLQSYNGFKVQFTLRVFMKNLKYPKSWDSRQWGEKFVFYHNMKTMTVRPALAVLWGRGVTTQVCVIL